MKKSIIGFMNGIYKRTILITGIPVLLIFAYMLILHGIPDNVNIYSPKENIQFDVPVTLESCTPEVAETFAGKSSAYKKDRTVYECKLFGIIPIKKVYVNCESKHRLIPGGMQVGIYAHTAGVMVVGLGEVTGSDGLNYMPGDNLIQPGDYILSIDGKEITCKEDILKILEKYKEQQSVEDNCGNILGTTVNMRIRRNGTEMYVDAEPVRTREGIYKLGIWVKDDLAGVGTLTYCTEEGDFAALGHCISDFDTNKKIDLGEGKLYEINIIDIVKGRSGTPGELTGIIDYSTCRKLGTITKNTDRGVYGKLERIPDGISTENMLEVGHKQDIEKGEAQIISSVDGELKCYNICITDVDYMSGEDKDIIFEVTDNRLLDRTGGIIQGMSGSVIKQNNKIIGAVTHVFVNDPAKGYGIFIEKMLEEGQ